MNLRASQRTTVIKTARRPLKPAALIENGCFGDMESATVAFYA